MNIDIARRDEEHACTSILFTGSGNDVALAAAATASVIAAAGKRTLLASIGPLHSFHALFDTPLSDTPTSIAPNMDAWSFNVLGSMDTYLKTLRPRLPGGFNRVSSDELPVMPGIDVLLGLVHLYKEVAVAYEVVVVDIGPVSRLLRVFGLPDSLRWLVRLLFGLDREPGRSTDSIANALVPTLILPFEWPEYLQNIRVRFERLRDATINVCHTTARYVMAPDAAALQHAHLAIPALQLHGLAVDALIAGPLLPVQTTDTDVAAIGAHQRKIVFQAEQAWTPRPLLRYAVRGDVAGIDKVRQLGEALYNGHDTGPIEMGHVQRPITTHASGEEPFLAIDLAGAPREALQLTLSNDELIVGIGPFRRHVLLPRGLRGTSKIKATWEAERLVVRLRE